MSIGSPSNFPPHTRHHSLTLTSHLSLPQFINNDLLFNNTMASAGLRRFLQHVPPISACFIGLHKASSCENNNSQSQSNSNHDQHVHHHNNTNTDYDYYIHHPTVDDLPILLHKFQKENLNVWPWIWTQSNENGPHHVYT